MLEFPVVRDPRGDLCFAHSSADVPFPIERIYYLYNVPPGSERGGHAHKNLEQVIVSVSGYFEISLSDGAEEKSIVLGQPHVGLYIPKMIWRGLKSFSADAVCLVLASKPYSEDDYVRNLEDFSRMKT